MNEACVAMLWLLLFWVVTTVVILSVFHVL